MKKNIIKYNLYALYDNKAETLAPPFIAQNNEIAMRHLTQTQKNMEKNGIIGHEDLTVVYLGQYQITVIKERDKEGNLIKFTNPFSDLNNIYDLKDATTENKEREYTEEEIEVNE